MTLPRRHNRWLSLIIFASLFGVLMLYRTGVLHRTPTEKGTAEFLLNENFQGRNAWMNIFQNHRKIGFSHTRYVKVDGGYQFDETVFMKINTMGMIQDLGLKTRGRLNADFSLAEFVFKVSSGRFSFSAQGTISGNRLTLVIDSAGTRQETQLALADRIYMPSGMLQAAVSGDLTPGNRMAVRVFDPIAMGQETIHLEVLDQEEIHMLGQPRTAIKLSLKYKGATQLAWVDEQGDILKEQGMLGITLEKTTREEALNGIPVQPSQDLTRLASIPSNIEFADPAALQVLKAEISGIQGRAHQLQGGRQTYQAPVLLIRKERIRDSQISKETPRPDKGMAVFLKSEPLIQSDHPAILKLARDITTGADNDFQATQRILAWIQQHIQKRPVLSMPDALAVLQNRVGDCNEHAVLFAALARASGIPTKLEAGVVYLKGRFYYHAWNAVYIGEWITVDALFNQIPADVTHIRITSGTPKDQLDILGLIGTMKIHVMDGTR
jgi:hypothetical protein